MFQKAIIIGCPGAGKSTFARRLQDKWIIDGNYGRTLEMRIQSCDTIFLLDFPVEECLTGAESRVGKQRADMPWTETEFDEGFRQWIIDFPKNELPVIYELLDRYRSEKNIYVFHTREDIEDYLLAMEKQMSKMN
ncbi:MAG: adenylate kinase [Eubacteriales bacterium]|nr:adenylate kinase [Eubacteriales bacterium]